MEQESLSPNIPLGEVPLKKREHLKINFSSKISFAQMLKWIFDIMFHKEIYYSNGYLTSCEKKEKFLAEN